MGELVRIRKCTSKCLDPGQTAVVLGNSQKPEIECNLENVLQDQIPIYKRSGGGTVLLSPKGFVTPCFKKDPMKSIDYFNRGTGALQTFLETEFSISSEPKGISDLSISNKKILGCSLHASRLCCLFSFGPFWGRHHQHYGYLAHPSLEPDYRKGRSRWIHNLFEETSS